MAYRDPYRSSAGDVGYAPQRWDSERFAAERDRPRFPRDREIAIRPRPRERSVDELYERRGPRGFEEDRYHSDTRYFDGPPQYGREPVRSRADGSFPFEREKEREPYREPSPPRRVPRPGLMRRQSSLDTFDRRPFPGRFDREEYGPPARLSDVRPPAFAREPLPVRRALPPPRRYEREIEVAEPDFYGDDDYRPYPERVREREIIRTRRRSKSRSRSRERSRARSVKESVRSDSTSSRETEVTKTEFPKRGKTRMPSRLVHKRAIIELGYPFEEEGEIIIIQKALGRENIDEVIKLSEEYKVEKVEMSGARSEAGETIVHDPHHHHGHDEEVFKQTTTFEHRDSSPAGHIVHEERRTEYVERSDPVPIGPGALIVHADRRKDERDIRAEIKALEAEKEALRAERRAEKELRRADKIRHEGRLGDNDELVLYEEEKIVTRSKSRGRRESEGVRIEKDRKGPDPKALKFMLKTLT